MRGLDGRIFSENNTISKRQSFRMLMLLLTASGTLVVPQLAAYYAGGLGVICIILANVIGYALMAAAENAAATKLSGMIFFIMLIVSGYYAIRVFLNVISETLLAESSGLLIFLMLMLLVVYGVSRGIESMARVAEIIFLFLLIPLALMLLSGLAESWREGISGVARELEPLDASYLPIIMRLIKGTAASLAGLAPAIFTVGISRYTKDRVTAFEAGKFAIIVSGTFGASLYFALTGIFGLPYLASMEYPVITLMSTVQSSMGFFKRADAFMTGILFFLMYIYVSTAVYFVWRMVLRVVKYGA